jgi:hypothetical protein
VKRLTDRDTAEHVFLLTLAIRIGPMLMIVLGSIEFYFWGHRFVWFILPDIAATALIVLGTSKLLGGVSHAAGSIHFPSGKGTPTPRQYSEQEALVIRGRFVEAADSYRAIIEDEPTNIEARLRLGSLLANECRDPVAAEVLYLEIRTLNPTAQQDWIASNALIDLYHREGEGERLKEELTRLSRRYRNTDAGAGAQRRLKELAEEETGPEERPT